ncbi:RluA family pseudouridine synthase [Deinococcus peraridilitoris]|uniref:Pseudouridine synthase n=1 Tax=Deinococcus peraridilitoris (strain DSM 19664 / LMG 22246 / CIP 109416 / KR-200) TaxID=937777 RepID=K9ZZ86_DEIPD|nr:RluA family pseudouridine synthase [Deinococcus peraridilitoris]AFZ66232.1 pseudouridine synthase, RluA family [Deinococcus peraridilitoris DSM 19664]
MGKNQGYAYREQLNGQATGQSTLHYLSARYPHSSPSQWQERLDRGEVLLDGRPARAHETLRAGQILVWHRPPWQEHKAPRHYEVLFEDDVLLAVNKPGGLPTLPGAGYLENTLLQLVRARTPHAAPLHRLGRATSGLVLFARTPQAAAQLSRAWRDRAIQKIYRALASGVAEHECYDIHAPIGPVPHPRLGTVHAASPDGKAARSVARPLERRADTTLFEVDIHTGRPHQIRIHLACVGHPLQGDPLYGTGGLPGSQHPGLPGDAGYLLHAEQLILRHPMSGATLHLRAPAPAGLRLTSEDS